MLLQFASLQSHFLTSFFPFLLLNTFHLVIASLAFSQDLLSHVFSSPPRGGRGKHDSKGLGEKTWLAMTKWKVSNRRKGKKDVRKWDCNEANWSSKSYCFWKWRENQPFYYTVKCFVDIFLQFGEEAYCLWFFIKKYVRK